MPDLDRDYKGGGGVSHLPTVEYFQKLYGQSMQGNDRKAVRAFGDFESHEKMRRLQNELCLLKDGKVKETTCDQVLGKTRKSKYNGYAHWAELMLLWISSHKK